ncbi:MAG: substrate-binding domain-containing protein [Acidimicrobiia bacterium]
MKRLWKAAVAAAGMAMVAGPLLAASPAGATPPTGYGFDDTSHVIVGGGSDTTYHVQLDLSSVWNVSQKNGCVLFTTVAAGLGNCISSGSPETNTLVNWQHDNLSQAPDVGSSAGVQALNGVIGAGGDYSYNGTVRTMPAGEVNVGAATGNLPDYARSSRGPKTSGATSSAPTGNELDSDTFWGFAQDGLEVTTFNSRGAQVQARAGAGAITPSELYHIYNCDFTQWSQVPSLAIAPGSATDGPIVAWGMNPSSGTYATMNTYLINNGGAPTGFLADAQACVKPITTGPNVYSIENDIKPIVNQPAALSTAANSVDNPANWIWWGSFGAFSAYPNTSKTVRAGTTVTAIAAPVNGVLPSTSGIIANTYPIGRTLYHVTRKNDADCPKTAGVCDFVGHPGPAIAAGGTDLNVTGATSGSRGAVREYTRFLCRGTAAQQGTDPFTGVNLFSAETGALNKNGFTTVPVGLRAAGSRCQLLTNNV